MAEQILDKIINIQEFIKILNSRFNDKYLESIGEPAEVVFSNGGSTYYADMLGKVFPGGRIYVSVDKSGIAEEAFYSDGNIVYGVNGIEGYSNDTTRFRSVNDDPAIIQSVVLLAECSSIEYGRAGGYLDKLAEELKRELDSSSLKSPDNVPGR